MRSCRLAVVLVAALLCAGCDWLQWGGSAGHAGSNPEEEISETNVAGLAASRVTPNAPTGQAVIANRLAFAAHDGVLTAYDVRSYGVVWTAILPAGSTIGTVPAVDLDVASSTVFVVVAGASHPILVGFDVNGVRNCNTL